MRRGTRGGIRGRGRGRGGAARGSGSSTIETNANPSAAFNETLQFITSIKLHELENQRTAYEAHCDVLSRARELDGDENLIAKVELLLAAVRSWKGSGSVDPMSGMIGDSFGLSNIDVWLLQAKRDPTFSREIVRSWADALENHILQCGTRFDFAKLFGNLFNEWLSSGDCAAPGRSTPPPDSSPTTPSEHFEPIGRQEMYQQKEKLSSLIFKEAEVDAAELWKYMTTLFSGDDISPQLDIIRSRVGLFGTFLLRTPISVSDVQWAVQLLLSSGLMAEEKLNTLREISNNSIVMNEVASVLNMRMASLATWEWPVDGLVIEMRRSLNGKYRAFTDPDVLDALFLQYIGTKWQVELGNTFRSFASSKAWKPSIPPLSKDELEKRAASLPEENQHDGIEGLRQEYRTNYFTVGQLPRDVESASSYDSDLTGSGRSIASDKAILLHLMMTDCRLNGVIHGKHTILTSDLEWFGPSLPHTSILSVLGFFGVPGEWIDFFKRFLRAPLKFKEEMNSTPPRVRERGTPVSYALSQMMGESILFVMDFAVNQRADGLFLYRIHDDLSLWGPDELQCAKAWEEMQAYAKIVGLTFNLTKTGCATVTRDGDVGGMELGLPKGDIRWGFLKFDSLEGRFIIDQSDIDTHIVEFRRQLNSTKSVFGWVNAYNKYMAFLMRHFGGRTAHCFGRPHLDDIIDTVARIQRELFPETSDGGAVGYLRKVLQDKFGARDLPQGYFYFPIDIGGLELRNPMIDLFSFREDTLDNPAAKFKKTKEQSVEVYKRYKEVWESNPRSRMSSSPIKEFISYEEYISQCETRLSEWRESYREMMALPSASWPPALPSAVSAAAFNVMSDFGEDSYWYKGWLLGLYGEEVIKKFGSLNVVDSALIPVGMVQLFRNSRMKWDQ